ncbi:MAG: SMP-30/gluconolactonase/LRE family protein [Burkholderiales bacterium]|nr:SMP-30/gluconolactonase/LRE family protein [Burkholderiales bacterium]
MSEATVVASGLRFPEGPVAMPDGTLLVVEIARDCLTRIARDGSFAPIAFTGAGPNGAAIGPDGKCYLCISGGYEFAEDAEHGMRPGLQHRDYRGGAIERVDLATGAVEVVYRRSARGALRGPNDLVFDRQGGFWFTDIGKNREGERDHGGVYYARTDGSFIREVIYPMVQPNGIGLAPDERTLYVAETVTGRVWAFDVTAPGEIAKRPFPSPNGGRLLAGLPGFQLFDSLAVDSAGHVCVATMFNAGITEIAPDGHVLAHVALPDRFTTNLCFGGPDLRTVFATQSSSGRVVAVPWPRPGLALNFSGR